MAGPGNIRDAEPGDAHAIAVVHVRTWQDAYRGIVPDDYLDALDVDERERRWREGISAPEGPIRVAEVEGDVVGWACYGPTRDTDTDRRRTGELYGIYVLYGHWGTGVGPALMDDALAWLRDRYPVSTLWTLEDNARARRFYERCGWRFDGATKDDDRETFVLREVRYRIGP
jgi:GNAT superfamily N-acetyltransferase